MRFDTSESTQGIEISQSGLTVTSTQKGQKAVCNVAMTEGVHYWEIQCPLKLQGIQFGVTTKGENPVSLTQTFHSTTERVVGVELNIHTLEMRFFIQSRYCKKQKIKKLVHLEKPAENLEWFALVEFKESGNTVTLNPFRSRPIPETTSAQALSKLPETLNFDPTHAKIALLEQLVGNHIIVSSTHPKADKYDL